MHVEPVDERDSSWEDHRPRFRVYLFEGGGPSFRTSTYDVTGGEVIEVVAWAEDQSGADGLYAVALVTPNQRGERGLTWLVGTDANQTPGRDLRTEMIRAAMHARKGRRSIAR